jgi:carboxypeptidase Taq
MDARAAYEELITHTRGTALLGSCAELLGWDEMTHMPPAGAEHRGRQMALLAGLRHERDTAPRVGELLSTLESSDFVRHPLSPEAVNVRQLRRQYDRRTRLPRDLVEELAQTVSMAQQEWQAARKASDFARFRPWLEKVVALKRRQAEALRDGGPLYDALLDEYEQGANSADLARLFAALAPELTALARAVAESPRRADPSLLRRPVPAERQCLFGEAVAAAVGFDFDAGRLDTSAHPFCCTVGPGDVRITTRFSEQDYLDAFFSTMHETGHALYEQGLEREYAGTPMGEAVSLGVHESQSRLWENLVARSRPFWRHFGPLARSVFRDALSGVNPDDFHRAINHVAPSLIRVQADEVTYNLHIIIRFELEQALLSGDLKAADVPGAWNEAYRRRLGVTPQRDAEGCLQDVHWSAGLYGYFPTYTLGNIFAAQLFDRAKADIGDLEDRFARGDFAGLLGWLRERVHRHGQRYPAAKLVETATGSPPDHRPLLDGLKRKYAELYGL